MLKREDKKTIALALLSAVFLTSLILIIFFVNNSVKDLKKVKTFEGNGESVLHQDPDLIVLAPRYLDNQVIKMTKEYTKRYQGKSTLHFVAAEDVQDFLSSVIEKDSFIYSDHVLVGYEDLGLSPNVYFDHVDFSIIANRSDQKMSKGLNFCEFRHEAKRKNMDIYVSSTITSFFTHIAKSFSESCLESCNSIVKSKIYRIKSDSDIDKEMMLNDSKKRVFFSKDIESSLLITKKFKYIKVEDMYIYIRKDQLGDYKNIKDLNLADIVNLIKSENFVVIAKNQSVIKSMNDFFNSKECLLELGGGEHIKFDFLDIDKFDSMKPAMILGFDSELSTYGYLQLSIPVGVNLGIECVDPYSKACLSFKDFIAEYREEINNDKKAFFA